METEFTIRVLSKAELALMYRPDLTPHSAVNMLMSWVKYSKPLQEELERAGYRKAQKLLTKKQVAIIVKHLGEP